jgi:hypothetical protein
LSDIHRFGRWAWKPTSIAWRRRSTRRTHA